MQRQNAASCSHGEPRTLCGSTFYRPDALPFTQPTASKHGLIIIIILIIIVIPVIVITVTVTV